MDILNLQGLIPGAAIESETSISVRVLRRRHKLPGCPHCGSEAIAPNGTRRLVMQTWTHHFPDLAAAYEAKEAFYAIYDCATRREAEAAYAALESSLTKEMRAAFAELLSAMKNWRGPIFNYLDHRVTNAYTEAMNGLIKIANRSGRGYSFEVLRARMLLNYRAIRHPELPKRDPSGEVMFKLVINENPRHYGFDLATTTRLLEGLVHEVTSTESAG